MHTHKTAETYIVRNCPCCGDRNSHDATIYTKERAEGQGLERLESCWNGFFKEKIIFSYIRCSSCGQLYAPIFLNEKQLGYLYSNMPDNMDVVSTEAIKKTQLGYFNELKKNSCLRGELIEVGPDVGWFVQACVAHGKFTKYWLLEPNLAVEEKLKKKVTNINHVIINDMTGLDRIPAGIAQVAVMIHVLDHLVDPVTFLREIRKKLAENGKIVIVTHNEKSLLAKALKSKWPAYCLQHPQLFNEKTIETVLVKSGFSVVKIKKAVNYFEIGFLLRHFIWALLGIKIKTPRFLNLTIGLKLGNMITIGQAEPNE